MGTYAEAYICITLDNDADAIAVSTMLRDVDERIQQRTGTTSGLNISDWDCTDDEEEQVFRLSSQRAQNLDWQVEQLIEELKLLVQSGTITKVCEFKADVMVAGDSTYMEEEEFRQPLKIVK